MNLAAVADYLAHVTGVSRLGDDTGGDAPADSPMEGAEEQPDARSATNNMDVARRKRKTKRSNALKKRKKAKLAKCTTTATSVGGSTTVGGSEGGSAMTTTSLGVSEGGSAMTVMGIDVSLGVSAMTTNSVGQSVTTRSMTRSSGGKFMLSGQKCPKCSYFLYSKKNGTLHEKTAEKRMKAEDFPDAKYLFIPNNNFQNATRLLRGMLCVVNFGDGYKLAIIDSFQRYYTSTKTTYLVFKNEGNLEDVFGLSHEQWRDDWQNYAHRVTVKRSFGDARVNLVTDENSEDRPLEEYSEHFVNEVLCQEPSALLQKHFKDFVNPEDGCLQSSCDGPDVWRLPAESRSKRSKRSNKKKKEFRQVPSQTLYIIMPKGETVIGKASDSRGLGRHLIPSGEDPAPLAKCTDVELVSKANGCGLEDLPFGVRKFTDAPGDFIENFLEKKKNPHPTPARTFDESLQDEVEKDRAASYSQLTYDPTSRIPLRLKVVREAEFRILASSIEREAPDVRTTHITHHFKFKNVDYLFGREEAPLMSTPGAMIGVVGTDGAFGAFEDNLPEKVWKDTAVDYSLFSAIVHAFDTGFGSRARAKSLGLNLYNAFRTSHRCKPSFMSGPGRSANDQYFRMTWKDAELRAGLARELRRLGEFAIHIARAVNPFYIEFIGAGSCDKNLATAGMRPFKPLLTNGVVTNSEHKPSRSNNFIPFSFQNDKHVDTLDRYRQDGLEYLPKLKGKMEEINDVTGVGCPSTCCYKQVWNGRRFPIGTKLPGWEYPIGTVIEKVFIDDECDGVDRPYEGMICDFVDVDGERFYSVRYEDHDVEQLSPKDVKKYRASRKTPRPDPAVVQYFMFFGFDLGISIADKTFIHFCPWAVYHQSSMCFLKQKDGSLLLSNDDDMFTMFAWGNSGGSAELRRERERRQRERDQMEA